MTIMNIGICEKFVFPDNPVVGKPGEDSIEITGSISDVLVVITATSAIGNTV